MGCPAHVLWKIRKHNINSMGHISQGTCSVTCVWEGHPVGADDVMSYATPSCVPYKGGQLLLTSFIAYKLWGSPHLLQRFFSMQVGCTQRVWMGLLHSRWRKKGKLLGVLRCRRAFVKVGNFFDTHSRPPHPPNAWSMWYWSLLPSNMLLEHRGPCNIAIIQKILSLGPTGTLGQCWHTSSTWQNSTIQPMFLVHS